MFEIRTAFIAAAAMSIIASIAFATVFLVYVPVSVDGTWYSYPAYALSEGGDPSENIPTVERTSPPPNRTVAKFGWENRSNLTVRFTEAWFKAFAPSWVSLKVFGVVQLCALALLIGAAVGRLTESPLLAVFAGCLVASDARVISEAASDARPDLFIAVFAALLLILLIDSFKTLKLGPIAAAAVAAVVLPLLHVTAANAVAFFLAFMACCVIAGRRLEGAHARIRIAWVIAILLVSSFVLKHWLAGILIPTQVSPDIEDEFVHHFKDEFDHIVSVGIGGKLMMEMTRWSSYFFRANTAHFALAVTAIIIAVQVTRKRLCDLPTTLALSLIAGFFAAALSMMLTDSHDLVPHALPVAILGYAGFAAVLGVAQRTSFLSRKRITQLCAGTLALAALLNVAGAFVLQSQFKSAGYSNAAAAAFLIDSLPKQGDVKVIGPTEIWPYLVTRRQPLLLIDYRSIFRHRGRIFDLMEEADFAGASYLILNKEYHDTYGWEEAADGWTKRGLIVGRKQLGDCDSKVQCLRIYALAWPTNKAPSLAPDAKDTP